MRPVTGALRPTSIGPVGVGSGMIGEPRIGIAPASTVTFGISAVSARAGSPTMRSDASS